METMTAVRSQTYQSHPRSERIRLVELYEQGLSSKRIARQLGLDDSMVRSWLRRYRVHGLEAMRPYWRIAGVNNGGVQKPRREANETAFSAAYQAYRSTLEPVASIARRFKLDYHAFKYHVERYHPELVAERTALKENNL